MLWRIARAQYLGRENAIAKTCSSQMKSLLSRNGFAGRLGRLTMLCERYRSRAVPPASSSLESKPWYPRFETLIFLNYERVFKLWTGGARPGAGRPRKPLKILRKVLAEEILSEADEKALWRSLLEDEDPRTRLEALRYLTDRRDGRPSQSIKVGSDSIEADTANRLAELAERLLPEPVASDVSQ